MKVRFSAEELVTIKRNYEKGQGGGFGGARTRMTLEKLQLLIDADEDIVIEVPE